MEEMDLEGLVAVWLLGLCWQHGGSGSRPETVR